MAKAKPTNKAAERVEAWAEFKRTGGFASTKYGRINISGRAEQLMPIERSFG